MALTPSTMLPLGTPAPDFHLPDVVSDEVRSYTDIAGSQATVVMFICNHCPYVIHVRPQLVALAKDYLPQGVGFVAISANDAQRYPEDGPAAMRALAQSAGFPFPYLYDESQQVARGYQAACTPDFYLFDGQRRCAYRGQLDGSRPGNGLPVTGTDLRAALDSLLAGKPIAAGQQPSVGCNIKWKSHG